jgi:S1-C subfamily serine protease
MTRTFLLCVVSGVAGVAATLFWYDSRHREPAIAAQEPARLAAPRDDLAGQPPGFDAPPTAPPLAPPRNELRPGEGGLRTPTVPVAPAAPLAPPDGPLPPANSPPVSPPAANPYDELTPDEKINVSVYQNVNRSVVNINTRSVQTGGLMMFEVPSEGEGSGTLLDRRGHVLTNFHVVDGAREVQVTLADGKSYEARLVGVDPATDVAVLKIEAPPDALVPIAFGNSANLLVGQRVFAIGNPFGLERTLTTGIISSLNRSLPARKTVRSIKSIIQIDAAINPGNSGGPLLDSRGRMIGMNTAIASRTGESAGVGFAIPVNTIARVVPQLLERGKVIRPDSGIARVYQTERGLLINALVPGGAAERAGLQGPRVVRQKKRQGPFVQEIQTIDRSAADLIVAVDGQPVRTGDDFLTAIEAKQPGESVMLTVIREGQQRRMPLRLETAE